MTNIKKETTIINYEIGDELNLPEIYEIVSSGKDYFVVKENKSLSPKTFIVDRNLIDFFSVGYDLEKDIEVEKGILKSGDLIKHYRQVVIAYKNNKSFSVKEIDGDYKSYPSKTFVEENATLINTEITW